MNTWVAAAMENGSIQKDEICTDISWDMMIMETDLCIPVLFWKMIAWIVIIFMLNLPSTNINIFDQRN